MQQSTVRRGIRLLGSRSVAPRWAILVVSAIRFGGLPLDSERGGGGMLIAVALIGSMVLFAWIAALPLTLAVTRIHRRARVLGLRVRRRPRATDSFCRSDWRAVRSGGYRALHARLFDPSLDCTGHHRACSAQPHRDACQRRRFRPLAASLMVVIRVGKPRSAAGTRSSADG